MGRRLVFEAARRRWPAVVLPFESFVAHLAALGWTEELPSEPHELFLSCACQSGDATACGILDREYLCHTRPAIAKIDSRTDFIDEVTQLVRHRVLAGERPQIGTYSGRGPLRAWLRMVASRIALDERRAARRSTEVAVDAGEHLRTLGQADSFLDPENVRLRRAYGPLFGHALLESIHELPSREHAVLKFYLVQKLNIDAIGRVYGVHRATVARWLARAREQVFLRVKSRMEAQLGELPTGEFDSLIRVLQGELDVSLSQLLRSNAGGVEDDVVST